MKTPTRRLLLALPFLVAAPQTSMDARETPAPAGRVVWQYETGGVTLDDEIVCFDRDTGDRRWAHRGATIDPARFAGFQTTPVLDGDRIYFGSPDGVVYGLEGGKLIGGRPGWRRSRRRHLQPGRRLSDPRRRSAAWCCRRW